MLASSPEGDAGAHAPAPVTAQSALIVPVTRLASGGGGKVSYQPFLIPSSGNLWVIRVPAKAAIGAPQPIGERVKRANLVAVSSTSQ